MNTEKYLLQIADAGLALRNTLTEVTIYDTLTVLLAVEDALDQGRILVSAAGGDVAEINKKMEQLRSKIRELMNQCEADELATYLVARGDRLKTQYSVHP